MAWFFSLFIKIYLYLNKFFQISASDTIYKIEIEKKTIAKQPTTITFFLDVKQMSKQKIQTCFLVFLVHIHVNIEKILYEVGFTL